MPLHLSTLRVRQAVRHRDPTAVGSTRRCVLRAACCVLRAACCCADGSLKPVCPGSEHADLYAEDCKLPTMLQRKAGMADVGTWPCTPTEARPLAAGSTWDMAR
jgi:hypothetical protein